MAGSITKVSIEKVKESTDIVELIGGYVPLKKAGGNFVGLCPFHQEKSPSFNVSPSRQMYHCFGCQKGGDAPSFLMDYEGLSFVEAIERLAKRKGIELEYEAGSKGGATPQEKSLKEKLYNVHHGLTEWWHGMLQTDGQAEIARQYLLKRGVDESSIKSFKIGYSPDKWDEILHWGKSKGYDEKTLELAGVIKRHEESGRYYSRFRGRLMFPIYDMQGRVIGFSGRQLKEEDKGAKYINSPETLLFKKNQILFGLDKARKSILDHDRVILCEGQLDTIRLHECGFNFSVAPQGTAFGEGHVKIIRRLCKEVILCFDSDQAGQNAAARVWEELLANELEVSVIAIPEGHDPDSYISEFGRDAFGQLIESRRNYFDFLIHFWGREFDISTGLGKREVVKRMGEIAQKCSNPILVDEISRKTALTTGTDISVIRQAWAKQERKKSNRVANNAEAPEGEKSIETPGQIILQSDPLPEIEKSLIQILLANEDHAFCKVHSKLVNSDWMTHEISRKIISAWIEALGTQGSEESGWHKNLLDIFSGLLDDSFLDNLCRGLIMEKGSIQEPEKQVTDILLKLRNQRIDSQINELTIKASQEELDEENFGILLRLQQNLREQKKQPLTDFIQSEADCF